MAASSLVEEQIESGRRLIGALGQKWTEVTTVFWVKRSDDEDWTLYIASPEIKDRGLRTAYRDLLETMSSLEDLWIQRSEVTLIDQNDPATLEILSLSQRHPTHLPMRLRRSQLGHISTEEVYVYPKSTESLKGFEEMKRRYPSATVFRLTVPNRPDLDKQTLPYVGKLNAENFEEKSSKTVLFLGLESDSSSPFAELVFVYRPEGWNTLFNPASGRWEDVHHALTNKPIYDSVDFLPLTDLKKAVVPVMGPSAFAAYT